MGAKRNVKEKTWLDYYKYAMSRGLIREEAEDFAQEAVLGEFLERRANKKFALVDFLRQYVAGRKDKESYEGRLKLSNAQGRPHKFFERLLVTDFTTPGIEPRLKEMNMIERIIVVLVLEWGFRNREVAHVLGVTEARINQILNAISERFPKDLA